MSWKTEKLKTLLAFTIVITIIAMLLCAGIGFLAGSTKAGALVGTGIGAAYFILGYWATCRIDTAREAAKNAIRDL